mmetsp:Transcript_1645/g.4922  ORF Transcript_1645/g.4922 Transcript_1645/m.4922 type:complete len:315 (+) Transcript_1645:96-1040(+)
MGGNLASNMVHDSATAVSPWTTQVRVESKCATPVLILLARNADAPTPDDAVHHTVPANSIRAINSGWLREPRATLLVRTGLQQASVIKVPHGSRITVWPGPHGLRIMSPDLIDIADFPHPARVPGIDTVPMLVRGESFDDADAADADASVPATIGSVHASSVVHDSAAAMSPWTTQVRIENKCATPVLIMLARNAAEPTPDDAVRHTVPGNGIHGISSGWLHDPRATLLVRTGLRQASIIRASHGSRISVWPAPHGLRIESPDHVDVEEFPNPASVPGIDTVPMLLRGESFDSEEGAPGKLQKSCAEGPTHGGA